MTEDDARALLRNFDGIGGFEAWMADQRWRPAPAGWSVAPDLEGWRFHLRVISGGLRITATAPDGGVPAVWHVP